MISRRHAPGWLLLLLALVARFGATGASALVYVAAAEQWPTTCRNLGVNFGASCGRLGSMISPFMRLLPSPIGEFQFDLNSAPVNLCAVEELLRLLGVELLGEGDVPEPLQR